MPHPLDNPVWNALVSGNRSLALGTDEIKFFDEQVSPFAALADYSHQRFLELADIYPFARPILLWADKKLDLPDVWNVVDCIDGYQMVYESDIIPACTREGITALNETNVTEMVALTRLTKPGPFGTRTIEFGNYEGVFDSGRLAAMTGRRFQAYDYIEMSAVCTHPDFLGLGYARKLLLSQLVSILESGNRAYLHVRQDNERAINVYKRIGLSVRMPVFFYVIKRV